MRHQRNNRINGCLTGSQCVCGARAEGNGDTCEKCVSRARWARRKARRTFDTDG